MSLLHGSSSPSLWWHLVGQVRIRLIWLILPGYGGNSYIFKNMIRPSGTCYCTLDLVIFCNFLSLQCQLSHFDDLFQPVAVYYTEQSLLTSTHWWDASCCTICFWHLRIRVFYRMKVGVDIGVDITRDFWFLSLSVWPCLWCICLWEWVTELEFTDQILLIVILE